MQSGIARYALGGVLVVVGLLLLLANSGLLPLNWGFIAAGWPLLLIAWGFYGLVSGGWRFRLWAVILLLLGVLFQLAELGFWEWSDLGRFWPVFLILAGLLLLLRRRGRRPARRRGDRELNQSPAEPLAAAEERDFLSGSWVFSSGASRVVSQNFQGGDLSVTFGGIELDLREAALAEGGAILTVEVIFGGVKLQVPGNWRVQVASSAHFGGVSENRRQPEPEAAGGELTIAGKLLFGGLEISD